MGAVWRELRRVVYSRRPVKNPVHDGLHEK